MRIRYYLDQKQVDVLFNSYIMSLFGYCPLVWVLCSKKAHALLIKTHKKALRVRFGNFSLEYEELLQKAASVSIHTKNLQLLVSEVFKTVNQLNPKIMWDSFNFKPPNKYQLRRGQNLMIPQARTTRAINSFDFRAAMAWNHIPIQGKNSNDLNEFNSFIKTKHIYCECIHCTP